MSLITTALWHLETRREDDLTLHRLASDLGVTPFHLSRAFRARTGMSVMGYLRARRLSCAALALRESSDTVLSIALASGYGSHQAFTRAFTRRFNQAPLAIRRGAPLDITQMTEAFAMPTLPDPILTHPEIRQTPRRVVIGLAEDHSKASIASIPALWARASARFYEVQQAESAVAFGVCYEKSGEGDFRYLAGIEAQPGAECPKGMERVEIPKGEYAVFTHSGHLSELPATIAAIWDHGLHDNGIKASDSPDFELYDSRMNPETGEGIVEIWIPIAR